MRGTMQRCILAIDDHGLSGQALRPKTSDDQGDWQRLLQSPQEDAKNRNEIPDEEEETVVSKEAVVVIMPADFTLSESCQPGAHLKP